MLSGEWARAVAMVSQEPVLFSGSIADNIAYGRFGRCSPAEIQAAAEAANAHEFILELPEGYNTLVGDRGTLLSGKSHGAGNSRIPQHTAGGFGGRGLCFA